MLSVRITSYNVCYTKLLRPEFLTTKLKLMPLEMALTAIHKPKNTVELKNATFRLKFEELFFIQLKILALKHNRNRNNFV